MRQALLFLLLGACRAQERVDIDVPPDIETLLALLPDGDGRVWVQTSDDFREHGLPLSLEDQEVTIYRYRSTIEDLALEGGEINLVETGVRLPTASSAVRITVASGAVSTGDAPPSNELAIPVEQWIDRCLDVGRCAVPSFEDPTATACGSCTETTRRAIAPPSPPRAVRTFDPLGDVPQDCEPEDEADFLLDGNGCVSVGTTCAAFGNLPSDAIIASPPDGLENALSAIEVMPELYPSRTIALEEGTHPTGPIELHDLRIVGRCAGETRIAIAGAVFDTRLEDVTIEEGAGSPLNLLRVELDRVVINARVDPIVDLVMHGSLVHPVLVARGDVMIEDSVLENGLTVESSTITVERVVTSGQLQLLRSRGVLSQIVGARMGLDVAAIHTERSRMSARDLRFEGPIGAGMIVTESSSVSVERMVALDTQLMFSVIAASSSTLTLTGAVFRGNGGIQLAEAAISVRDVTITIEDVPEPQHAFAMFGRSYLVVERAKVEIEGGTSCISNEGGHATVEVTDLDCVSTTGAGPAVRLRHRASVMRSRFTNFDEGIRGEFVELVAEDIQVDCSPEQEHVEAGLSVDLDSSFTGHRIAISGCPEHCLYLGNITLMEPLTDVTLTGCRIGLLVRQNVGVMERIAIQAEDMGISMDEDAAATLREIEVETGPSGVAVFGVATVSFELLGFRARGGFSGVTVGDGEVRLQDGEITDTTVGVVLPDARRLPLLTQMKNVRFGGQSTTLGSGEP